MNEHDKNNRRTFFTLARQYNSIPNQPRVNIADQKRRNNNWLDDGTQTILREFNNSLVIIRAQERRQPTSQSVCRYVNIPNIPNLAATGSNAGNGFSEHVRCHVQISYVWQSKSFAGDIPSSKLYDRSRCCIANSTSQTTMGSPQSMSSCQV